MKAPYLPSFSAKLALAAGRAGARIAAVAAVGEDVRPEQLVEASSTCVGAQVLDLADRGGELAPEVAQQLLPVDLAGGDLVELLLQIGGEVVLDVVAKNASRKAVTSRPLSSGMNRFFSSRT